MFKNVLLYRLEPEWNCSLEELNQALATQEFSNPSASQETALGWVPARGIEHGPLVESVAGQWIMRLRQESKSVPATVVAQHAQQQAQEIEQVSGRRPGKKEVKEMKEQIRHGLLPRAFARISHTMVWLNPQTGWLVVDASSYSKADDVLSLLTKALSGFSARMLQPKVEVSTSMSGWLLDYQIGNGFNIGSDCELKAITDDRSSSVKYNKHNLDLEEIRQHIKQGKRPNKLELDWQDKVSFVLTAALELKRVKFNDSLYDNYAGASADERFDTDVAIATAELELLFADLLQILDVETD